MYIPPNWMTAVKCASFTNNPLTSMDKSSHLLLQLVLFVSLLSSAHALLGSTDEQASLFDPQNLLIPEQPDVKLSRLETLIELKKSIAEILNENDQQAQTPDMSGDKDKEILTNKRVFCNGFTGCGGRFRGKKVQQRALEAMRKRMLKAAATSRPICNNNGCFNGGKRKKESDRNPIGPAEDTFNLREEIRPRFNSLQRSNGLKSKRLFCNGFHGCRNMGKRGLLLQVLVGKDKSEMELPQEDQKHILELMLRPNKEKRFFAASYDQEMDDFVDDMSWR